MTERSARLVLVFAAAGHALYHVLAALYLTIVLALVVEWRRPYDELIALWTLGAFLVGVGAPISGWLSDRFGETRVMIVFFIGLGFACLACGLMPTPAALQWTLAGIGLFGAIYHPVGTAWVVKNTRTRGRTIAWVGMAGSAGVAVASLVAGGITDLAGWRTAFILPGALTVAVGLALLACYLRGIVLDRREDLAPEAAAMPPRGGAPFAIGVLLTTMCLSSIAWYTFSTMIPKWFALELGLPAGGGLVGLGLIVTLAYLVAASAQFVGGHLTDRGHAKWTYVASHVLKLGALAVAMYVSGWSVLPAAIVIMMVFDVAAPIENVLVARYAPAARRGIAYGIRHGIVIVSAPLGVQIVSRLFDESRGFGGILQVLCVLIAALALIALLLPSDRPQNAMSAAVRQPGE